MRQQNKNNLDLKNIYKTNNKIDKKSIQIQLMNLIKNLQMELLHPKLKLMHKIKDFNLKEI